MRFCTLQMVSNYDYNSILKLGTRVPIVNFSRSFNTASYWHYLLKQTKMFTLLLATINYFQIIGDEIYKSGEYQGDKKNKYVEKHMMPYSTTNFYHRIRKNDEQRKGNIMQTQWRTFPQWRKKDVHEEDLQRSIRLIKDDMKGNFKIQLGYMHKQY